MMRHARHPDESKLLACCADSSKERQGDHAKNSSPEYRLVDVDAATERELSEAEKIDIVAARILKRYRGAFLELTK